MKKTLMLVLVVALAFSCFAAVLTAGASTEIAQGTKAEKGNYFKIGDKDTVIRDIDFENMDEASKIAENAVPNLYLAMQGTGSFDIVSTAVTGNRSLKVTNSGFAWATRLLYIDGMKQYTEAGTYRVSYKVKTNNATLITTEVRCGWENSASNFLADFRYAITNDASGNAQSVAKDTAGWTGADQSYTNGSCTVENGVISVSFEYTIDSTKTLATNTPEVAIYGANLADGTATYIFDDFKVEKLAAAPKYYTIDWDVDYNAYTELQQAIDGQPAWGDTLALDANWIDDTQCLKIVAGAGTKNAQIGGFEQREAYIQGKKLVKHAAVTYFQYDIAVDGCEMVNIWTGGAYYTSVAYNGTSWSGAGNVSGFNAQELDSGAYRLSYFIDMTANRDMDFNLNVDSTSGGAVYIDNLVIAHEDYSAYLKPTAMYYFANTEDVSLDFDAKGKDVTSVKLDDVALTAEDYTIADGKLTIKASKLAGSELGKKYTLSVVTSASETAVTAEISQIDNRASVTAEYKGEALAAVTYNGTTAYEKAIALSLSGVAEGDEVTVSGTAALASKNAGSNKVVVSNLVLAGKGAAKYKLANTSVEIAINVDKLQLTIGDATVADKTYDGTTTANVTAGALNGVVEGDNVTVAAAGEFNSKDVTTANKVVVTYTIDGEDAANYIAPVNGEVAKTISKASVTVTANAATKEEGAADPELTYTATGLVDGDKLNGKLARTAGETAGEYDITVGTLANDNYEITFTGAKLTVTAKSQPTPDPKPEPTPDTKPDEEKKGCFGVVGTASVAAFTLLAAAAVVVCKRKDD